MGVQGKQGRLAPTVATATSVAEKLLMGGLGRGVGIGRYYHNGRVAGAYSNSMSTAANWMSVVPWMCPMDMTVDRIGIYSQSVTGNIRLGIYSSSPVGVPSTLVMDSGAIAVGSSGAKEASIWQPLLGGRLYFLACVADANLSISGTTSTQIVLHMGGATLAAAQAYLLAGSQTYGALPFTPPSLAYDASTTAPLIAMRAA